MGILHIARNKMYLSDTSIALDWDLIHAKFTADAANIEEVILEECTDILCAFIVLIAGVKAINFHKCAKIENGVSELLNFASVIIIDSPELYNATQNSMRQYVFFRYLNDEQEFTYAKNKYLTLKRVHFNGHHIDWIKYTFADRRYEYASWPDYCAIRKGLIKL